MIECAVRPATPDDVRTLVALCGEHARFERALYEPQGKEAGLARALFGEAARLQAWLATVHGRAVGYAAATEEFSTWQAESFLCMDCLFVLPRHRNGGIGAALLHAVVQYARARDLHEVQWQTPTWNTDASRFYRRHGAVANRKLRFCLPVDGARNDVALTFKPVRA